MSSPRTEIQIREDAVRAQADSRWSDALALWGTDKACSPDVPEGYAGVGVALQFLNRTDEADTMLLEAVRRFPQAVNIAVEYARVAHRSGDWDAALHRWVRVVANFPNNADGFAGTGIALQMLGRPDDADAFLKSACERLPQSPSVAIEYARVPHRCGEWPEAAQRWESVVGSFPDNPEGYSGYGVALQQLGRNTDAEDLLRRAVERFPSTQQLAIEYARVAEQRNDWPEAQRRWNLAMSCFPQDQTILEGVGRSQFHAQVHILDESGKETPSQIELGAANTATEVMMRFESLGSGCEFGLVQRHYGAEPLGLLRWGAIPPLALAEALRAKFLGLGNPENVCLFEFGDSKEYFFRDTRFSLEMHTFIPAARADYDRVFAQQCRRAQYLARKLLDDLEHHDESSKVFVYKRHVGSLSDDEIAAIHWALRRFGEHVLLCLRPECDGHPNGTLVDQGDGLLIGYLDALSPTSNAKEIKYSSWADMCHKAYRLVRQRWSSSGLKSA